MKELAGKQQHILEFLRTFIEDKDYPPSIRDIQEGCGISSTSVVDYNLRKLEEKKLHPPRPRSLPRHRAARCKGRRTRIVEIPILGTIAAGQPIPVPTSERWSNDAEDTVTVTEDMVKGRDNVFALRVKGTSMIEDLIDDGDIVFLEPAACRQRWRQGRRLAQGSRRSDAQALLPRRRPRAPATRQQHDAADLHDGRTTLRSRAGLSPLSAQATRIPRGARSAGPRGIGHARRPELP